MSYHYISSVHQIHPIFNISIIEALVFQNAHLFSICTSWGQKAAFFDINLKSNLLVEPLQTVSTAAEGCFQLVPNYELQHLKINCALQSGRENRGRGIIHLCKKLKKSDPALDFAPNAFQ